MAGESNNANALQLRQLRGRAFRCAGRRACRGPGGRAAGSARGGYEIVDKFLRKEIYIHGALAESFKVGVEKLIRSEPSEEEMDDFIEGFTSLMQQSLVFH